MSARDAILSSVRRSLRRGPVEGADEAPLARRLEAPERNLVPARADLPPAERLALFVSMATAADATVTRVDSTDHVPQSLAAYLKEQNLPARVRMAPHPGLEALPWDRAGMLEIVKGAAEASDEVGLAPAFAGVAETGTLVLHSGPENPTTLNFLPDTEVVVIDAADVVASYEDAWDRIRAKFGRRALPRTVNMVTGPSRSADIEQTLQLGAHGPRRLHIVIHGQPR